MTWLLMSALVALAGPSQASTAQEALRALTKLRADVSWKSSSGLVADIDCDERPEQVFVGRTSGTILIGVVPTTGGKPEVFEFSVGGAQAGVCQEPVSVEMESLDFDPDEQGLFIRSFQQSKSCKGLQFSGVGCDATHLFWNHDEQRLDWWKR